MSRLRLVTRMYVFSPQPFIDPSMDHTHPTITTTRHPIPPINGLVPHIATCLSITPTIKQSNNRTIKAGQVAFFGATSTPNQFLFGLFHKQARTMELYQLVLLPCIVLVLSRVCTQTTTHKHAKRPGLIHMKQ